MNRRRLLYVGVAAAAIAVVGVQQWRVRCNANHDALHARAVETFMKANAVRRDAVREAMRGAIVPRPDLGPCPVDASGAKLASITDVRDLDDRNAFMSVRDVPWPDDIHLLSVFERTIGSHWQLEIDVVSRDVIDRFRSGEHAPPPAETEAFLFDWRAGKIVCAAELPRRKRDGGAEIAAVEDSTMALSVAGPPR
ncbi:MAG TPA: hypothetical protein VIF62_39780 [Labilithrix sp.]